MRQPAGHRAVAASVVCALALVSSVLGQGTPYPSARTGGNYMHNYYLPPAPSSTPWAPAWSPDGRWIAVAMSGSIWKVDPANGVAHEITYDEKYHSMPVVVARRELDHLHRGRWRKDAFSWGS